MSGCTRCFGLCVGWLRALTPHKAHSLTHSVPLGLTARELSRLANNSRTHKALAHSQTHMSAYCLLNYRLAHSPSARCLERVSRIKRSHAAIARSLTQRPFSHRRRECFARCVLCVRCGVLCVCVCVCCPNSEHTAPRCSSSRFFTQLVRSLAWAGSSPVWQKGPFLVKPHAWMRVFRFFFFCCFCFALGPSVGRWSVGRWSVGRWAFVFVFVLVCLSLSPRFVCVCVCALWVVVGVNLLSRRRAQRCCCCLQSFKDRRGSTAGASLVSRGPGLRVSRRGGATTQWLARPD